MNDDEAPVSSDPAHLKLVVEIWKEIVSVQMHFNDIEMKVRNLYFTILAASMALMGVVQGKRVSILYADISISLALLVVLAIIPVSALFYFIDRHWYHRMLLGAVYQAGEIEKKYSEVLPELQLGKKISAQSPVKFRWPYTWLLIFIRDERFVNERLLHSDQKIEVLYKSVMWGAAVIFLVYGIFNGIQTNDQPLLKTWLAG